MSQQSKIIAAVETNTSFHTNTSLNFNTGMMINMEIMATKSECRTTWLIWHLHDQRVPGYHSFQDINILCVMCNFMYLTTRQTDLQLNLSSCPILPVLFISAYIVCLLKKQTRHTVTAFAVVIVTLCLCKFIQQFFLIRMDFEFPKRLPSAVSNWNSEILWDSVNF